MRGLERDLVVGTLVLARLLDVVGDSGERGHDGLQDGKQEAVGTLGVHRRVDEHDAADGVAMALRESQRERATHGEPEDEDDIARALEFEEGPVGLGVPVLPASEIHVLPAGAVTREARHAHCVTLGRHALTPGLHGLRRAGEAVEEQDARGAAVGDKGLSTGNKRHSDLLGRP